MRRTIASFDTHEVEIDGKPNTLTLASIRGDGARQYNTKGNESAHTFTFKLEKGMRFYTGGTSYKILS